MTKHFRKNGFDYLFLPIGQNTIVCAIAGITIDSSHKYSEDHLVFIV